MGAIAGILRFDAAPTAAADLRAVSGRMRHRSPDGIACWESGEIALSHGCLRATPETQFGIQPIRLHGRFTFVIDCLVDNRAELQRSLGLGPDGDTPLDDAQLLAMAYLQWGESLWMKVRGEYAIAVWDTQDNSLALLRDRLGARPICYARTTGFFAFASEADALLGLPGVPSTINELRLAGLWHPGLDDEVLESTTFEHIRKVPPASCLKVSHDGRVAIDRYWQMEPLPELQLSSDQEYVEAFQEVFGNAVRDKARAASTPALMLSGGIDSASILAARRGFRQQGPVEDLLTISAVAEGDVTAGQRQETANIRDARGSHRLAIELPVPGFDGLVTSADLAEAAFSPAHPGDGSLLLPAMVYLAARRSGSNVVLDGIDGDLIMGSPKSYLSGLISKGNLWQAWSEARQASVVHTYLRGISPGRLYASAVLRALAPRQALAVLRRLRLTRRTRSFAGSPLRPDLIERIDLAGQLRKPGRQPAVDAKVAQCQTVSTYIPFALEVFAQVASRYGVEARHPWADQRVIDFFLGLPLRQKVRNGWTKQLARKACEPALGRHVAWHSGKEHLGPLLTRRLVIDTLPYARGLVEQQRGTLTRYFTGRCVDEWLTILKSPDLGDPAVCDTIRETAILARWLEFGTDAQTHNKE